VDELIYIHLSKKTNEQGYSEAFNRLSSSFPNWEGLADADPEIVKSLIGFAGLGNQRTKELLANIKQIRSLFGDLNLDQLRCWNNKKIFDFLTSLSGIGTKSALCIMMYSLKKQVFPVDTHVHTICERMGFIIDGLDHDRAQTILEEMFPKKLRFSLHVNMVAHGRKVCRKRGRPLCELCNLSKFCLYFRSFQKPQDQRYSMIDLFCGAGGASLGLKDAGFSIKLAIDNSRKATDTYYLNNEELSFDQVITCNIESLDTEFLKEQVHEVTLIFGGPPCQGWSIIGKNRKNGTNGIDFLKDQKNALYKEFARQLDIFKPRYFVMENVPALASVDNGKYVRIIKKEFKGYGYASVSIKLNASDFGVSQNRKRIFFIGRQIYLKEQGVDSAIKELNKIVARVRAKAKKCDQSFKDIIQDLPSLRAGEGSNVLGLNDSGIKHGIKPKLIFNHIARKHNERDLKIYKLLSEGEDYGHFSRRCKGKELLPYNTKSFKTKFRKINGNSYCHAIISHLSKDSNSYIHPYDERGITVREAARVQSFPDDFIFLPKGFSQFIYLGNAVPPKLARVIGDSIIETLKGVKTK
jgi:DNA (cytosine-5)-methyltransferase 1